MERRWANIDLVRRVDTFPDSVANTAEYETSMRDLYTVVWRQGQGEETPIGYMRRDVYQKLLRVPRTLMGEMRLDPDRGTVSLFQWDEEANGGRRPIDEPERTRRVAALTEYLRHGTDDFATVKKSWRGEPWPVYGPGGALLFSMERAALGMLGSMRYGVHVNAYVSSPGSTHGIKIWVPKRAATKASFPGMLDNAVAGGLMTAEDPFECMVREADEEASLPGDVVRARAREVGSISYIYVTDARSGEAGYVYPEYQWVYDLELPEDVVPRPKDGEVESFALRTVDEVREDMAAGRFKPNCAAVMLDFFIRRGIVDKSVEPHYDEIMRRLHRPIPFPGPHQKLENAPQQ